MLTALELERALNNGRDRFFCANPTCAKPVRVRGDYCSLMCAPGCYLCKRRLFPGHVHIPRPKPVDA